MIRFRFKRPPPAGCAWLLVGLPLPFKATQEWTESHPDGFLGSPFMGIVVFLATSALVGVVGYAMVDMFLGRNQP